MKNYLLLLTALTLILSSCSSRYGHIPKARKHNRVVKAKKHQPAKKDIKETPVISAKKPPVNVAAENSITRTEVTVPNLPKEELKILRTILL